MLTVDELVYVTCRQYVDFTVLLPDHQQQQPNVTSRLTRCITSYHTFDQLLADHYIR